MALNLKDIVSNGNKATFRHLRAGLAFYLILVELGVEGDALYTFPVPVADLQGETLYPEEWATTLLRYIRKAIDEGTFVKA